MHATMAKWADFFLDLFQSSAGIIAVKRWGDEVGFGVDTLRSLSGLEERIVDQCKAGLLAAARNAEGECKRIATLIRDISAEAIGTKFHHA